jgi:hypothetical protein
MAEVQLSNKQIAQFKRVADVILKFSPERHSRLYFAVEKMNKRCDTHVENYADQEADLRRQFAMTSTDPKEKGKLLRDDRNQYQYTAEGEGNLHKKLRELANKKIEIKSHLLNEEDIPEDLTLDYEGNDGNSYTLSHFDVKTALAGFVLPLIEEDDAE